LAVLALFATLAFAQDENSRKNQAPPVARRDNVQEVLHGVTVSDPYQWLEDQNSPETRAWITAENAYTHAQLDAWQGRSALEKRVTELRKVDRVFSPLERKGRLFYRRRGADQEQYVIYMRRGDAGKEEVLVDPNSMSADHSTNVELADVSKDGKILAYQLRTGGKDETEIHLLEVDTRRELPDVLPARVYFDLSFLPDSTGFYYATMLDDGPRVRFHKMGTAATADTDTFGQGYAKEAIIVGDPTEDGRHLVIQVLHGSAADKTEVWLKDLTTNGPIEPLVKDVDARFLVSAGKAQLFLFTNWKAPRGRVLAVDFRHAARELWREVIPESETAIDNVNVAGGKIIVTYVKNASSQVKIFEPDGKLSHELSFPALGTVGDLQSTWGNRDAFLGFQSFTIPPTVYRFNIATGKGTVWYQAKVPLDSSRFEVEQVWFTSKDGTRVPMFLVHARGLKADGTRPALLTGYGGFVVNITPTFSPEAILWAEHGGVYAEANLRGGGEFGEAWHKAGMLGNKQNVFDDFISASEWLIQNKYAGPGKLAIAGGSNGGLLVGAALTQRPDLYQAVVCWHPLLDMLRYDKFMEAQFWVSEYGSANDPEQFKWLYAYSPYQHVKSGTSYPAVLFMTGDGDTRVAPLHARKMAALLQASTGSDRPVLLRYEMTAGHSGGRSVTQEIGDTTDRLSFLFWRLGIAP
jgi:prolyl oligopeptidase